MTAAQNLILITGATGHIGYAVLVKALEAGYNVRATLRDASKATQILKTISIGDLGPVADRLSFVTVPDVTSDGSYDEALNGVTYVIHVASPIPRSPEVDLHRDIIDPAVKGTTSLLASAFHVPTVKRVVITSSVIANIDTWDAKNNPNPVTPEHRLSNYPKEFVTDIENAYAAAKTAALNATDSFVKEKRPEFDVINIMPSFVFGRKGLATTVREIVSSSNLIGVGLVMNHDSWRDRLVSAASCHIDDVSEAHVRALDPSITGNQAFALATPFSPPDVAKFIRTTYPEQVKQGLFSATGSYKWFHIPYDAQETEKVLLGRKFKGIEEQIRDTVEQILEHLPKGT